jgi:uncharacterized membrane protein
MPHVYRRRRVPGMASASVQTQRPPWATIVAVAAVVSLALWPVELHSAFGLPAHPLIVHVPVVFIPILGLAVLAVAFKQRWFDRYGILVAAFSVVSLAFTLLAVGAGEAFREERERVLPRSAVETTLHDHADAGITVRLSMLVLTALLVALLFVRRRGATIALRVLAVLFALTALVFVFRTGHLGAKLAWDTPLTESTK